MRSRFAECDRLACALVAARSRSSSARDHLLGELAVQRAVGDARRAAVELDQHPGRPRLVDVGGHEAKRRRAVGVPVDLLVQLLGLGDERVGLRAQPQRLEVTVVDGAQVDAEAVLVGVAQRLADRPTRIAGELRSGDRLVCDALHELPRDRRRDVADAQQRVDRADGDRAAADELLSGLGQLEDLCPGADELTAPAERLRGAVQRVALVEHRLHGSGLVERRELLARDVLRCAVCARALLVADDDRRVGQVELAACRIAVIAGDELIAVTGRSDDERDEQPPQGDRLREVVDVRLVEFAHVLAQADVIQRQAKLAGGGSTDGHAGLLGPLMDKAAGRTEPRSAMAPVALGG